MPIDVATLLASLLQPGTKGLPLRAALPLAGVREQGWNLLRQDLPLPAAVLRASALDHNSRLMREFVARTGTRLCPHGKTTMAPQLFARQLADGAWGLTAATYAHLQTYRKYGVDRVIFANQLVDPVAIEYVFDELDRDPNFDFYALVDSLAGLQLLVTHARRRSGARPLQLLVEIGAVGGRTGARTVNGALELARNVAQAAPALALRGFEAFEGIYSPTQDAAALNRVSVLLEQLREATMRARHENLFSAGPVIVSAGGSAFFEECTNRLQSLGPDVAVVLRSGCYLTHDHGLYARALAADGRCGPGADRLQGSFRPALEVWGYVQSRPERDLALATFGKRDVSYDLEMPIPILWFRPGTHDHPQTLTGDVRIKALNDQHAYVELPGNHPARIGDMLAVGVSHPCTTFDKWPVLLEIDDDYNVIGAVKTCF